MTDESMPDARERRARNRRVAKIMAELDALDAEWERKRTANEAERQARREYEETRLYTNVAAGRILIEPSQAGVYAILNRKARSVYIGETGVSFKQRWRQHRGQLRRGTHYHKLMQFHWNTLGADSFEFYALEAIEADLQTRQASERKWAERCRRGGYYVYSDYASENTLEAMGFYGAERGDRWRQK